MSEPDDTPIKKWQLWLIHLCAVSLGATVGLYIYSLNIKDWRGDHGVLGWPLQADTIRDEIGEYTFRVPYDLFEPSSKLASYEDSLDAILRCYVPNTFIGVGISVSAAVLCEYLLRRNRRQDALKILKPKRRWFQFHLSTLIVTSLMTGLFGIFDLEIESVRIAQNEAGGVHSDFTGIYISYAICELVIVLATAQIIEWRLRRREGAKP